MESGVVMGDSTGYSITKQSAECLSFENVVQLHTLHTGPGWLHLAEVTEEIRDAVSMQKNLPSGTIRLYVSPCLSSISWVLTDHVLILSLYDPFILEISETRRRIHRRQFRICSPYPPRSRICPWLAWKPYPSPSPAAPSSVRAPFALPI